MARLALWTAVFIVSAKDGKPYVQVAVDDKNKGKIFSPEEISAMILAKMKETAEVGHV